MVLELAATPPRAGPITSFITYVTERFGKFYAVGQTVLNLSSELYDDWPDTRYVGRETRRVGHTNTIVPYKVFVYEPTKPIVELAVDADHYADKVERETGLEPFFIGHSLGALIGRATKRAKDGTPLILLGTPSGIPPEVEPIMHYYEGRARERLAAVEDIRAESEFMRSLSPAPPGSKGYGARNDKLSPPRYIEGTEYTVINGGHIAYLRSPEVKRGVAEIYQTTRKIPVFIHGLRLFGIIAEELLELRPDSDILKYIKHEEDFIAKEGFTLIHNALNDPQYSTNGHRPHLRLMQRAA